jgi:heat shock protein HslJ
MTILCGLLLLGGCTWLAPVPPHPSPTPISEPYGEWRLLAVSDAEGELDTTASPAPLSLHLDQRANIWGIGTCNSFGGKVTIDDGALALETISFSQVGCAERDDIEKRYFDALAATDELERDGDRLHLTGTDTRLDFELVTVPVEALIVNTEWSLQSVRNADLAVLVDPGLAMVFETVQFTASTGCRIVEVPIGGGDDASIRTIDAVVGCTGIDGATELRIYDALASDFRLTLAGDVLTLEHPGVGTVLTFGAVRG